MYYDFTEVKKYLESHVQSLISKPEFVVPRLVLTLTLFNRKPI